MRGIRLRRAGGLEVSAQVRIGRDDRLCTGGTQLAGHQIEDVGAQRMRVAPAVRIDAIGQNNHVSARGWIDHSIVPVNPGPCRLPAEAVPLRNQQRPNTRSSRRIEATARPEPYLIDAVLPEDPLVSVTPAIEHHLGKMARSWAVEKRPAWPDTPPIRHADGSCTSPISNLPLTTSVRAIRPSIDAWDRKRCRSSPVARRFRARTSGPAGVPKPCAPVHPKPRN